MKVGEIIKRARLRANMTLTDLAELISSSSSTLSNIENDHKQNPLSPADMVKISDAVMDRKMLEEFCIVCPIRKRILIKKFPPLNNIVPGAPVAIMKMINKLAEAGETLQPMLARILNSNFRNDPDFREYRNRAVLKLIDAKRGAEIALDQLVEQGIITSDEVTLLVEVQQQQCVDKGHHVEAEG